MTTGGRIASADGRLQIIATVAGQHMVAMTDWLTFALHDDQDWMTIPVGYLNVYLLSIQKESMIERVQIEW